MWHNRATINIVNKKLQYFIEKNKWWKNDFLAKGPWKGP
jgi:hypothetical protein